jgi:flagellar basal-body rod protein FlgB
MKSTGISSNQLDYLEHALDVTARRQQLIAGNIANANTPGFRTKDLDFASALKSARWRTWPITRSSTRSLRS